MFPVIGQSEVIPKRFNNGPNVSLPVGMLLGFHNNLDIEHPMRAQIIEYIREFAAVNKKSHWTRAIVQSKSGDLVFDETLYDLAVNRGKQETRLATSEKAFKELQQQLEFLAKAHQREQECSQTRAMVEGETLLPLPDYSPNLARINEHAPALIKLTEQMNGGLANNVAGSVSGKNTA
jgi:hypothetical protein